MKNQMILLSLFILTHSFPAHSSEPAPLQDFFKKSVAWTIAVNTSPFKKSTLKVTDHSPTPVERTFPICSSEDATMISSSLSESFRGLPSGYQNCFHQILTGADDQELFILTPKSATIQDKKEKSLRFSNPRRSISSVNTQQ